MSTKEFFEREKQAATHWAKDVLADPNTVILDTETTKLDGEFVQIAVIDSQGNALLDTLVKPKRPEDVYIQSPYGERESAYDIHGIGPEDVKDAPTFPDIYEELRAILQDKRLVIYNAGFDWVVMKNVCMDHRLKYPKPRAVECAMIEYARWFGEWSEYRDSFRWQKLEGGDHSALGDCLATLERLREMADG